MSSHIPFDACVSIAFAGGHALSRCIGMSCSSYRALNTREFLLLLRDLCMIQLEMDNDTRRTKLINISNTMMVYTSFSWETIYPHCIGILAAMARWDRGRRAHLAREVAIMILGDFGLYGKQQLVALRLEAEKVASELQRRGSTEAWRIYEGSQDCFKRRQGDAALVAGDLHWLHVEPPSVYRARHFFLENAPSTPYAPSDSSDSGT